MLDKINFQKPLTRQDLKYILSIEYLDELKALFRIAYQEKIKQTEKKVYFRGLIEFSNICIKDCYYCGIRKSNKLLERFTMKEEEILQSAKWAYENKYGSIVLQSGERNDNNFIDFVEEVVRQIKNISNGELGITLSLGEQNEETYKRWFNAGAHRYLLRIETTNENLYKKLHPSDHRLENRKSSLQLLKDLGFQVGTGVMIGLPFQTIDDLVDDLIFFKEIDIDMLGMGPYIKAENTPLALKVPNLENIKEKQYLLSLKMISAARLLLKDVNIAATTALQSLNKSGREMGLMAGANIIMPNLTDIKYRKSYQLYKNKYCNNEDSETCSESLEESIYSLDESIGYNEWGDSPHYFSRMKQKEN